MNKTYPAGIFCRRGLLTFHFTDSEIDFIQGREIRMPLLGGVD